MNGDAQNQNGIHSIREDARGEAISSQHQKSAHEAQREGSDQLSQQITQAITTQPTKKVLPLFLDKIDRVEAQVRELQKETKIKGMTDQFQFSQELKRVFITKEEHDQLQADLYRSDALADKRYAEVSNKLAEMLQKQLVGTPGGQQGYDKFVTDMLEAKLKKLIAWQQEQYENQEQNENYKQNQSRFLARVA